MSLSPIGIVHTVISLVALAAAVVGLNRHREMGLAHASGRVYVAGTLITAVTALLIYQRGGFGGGHVLALLTLAALAVAVLAERRRIFGARARVAQAVAYAASLLFHLIPGVTETLTRLPPAQPLAADAGAPLVGGVLLVVVVAGAVGLWRQIKALNA